MPFWGRVVLASAFVCVMAQASASAAVDGAAAYAEQVRKTLQKRAVYPPAGTGASNIYEFEYVIGRDGYILRYSFRQRQATSIALGNAAEKVLDPVAPPIPAGVSAPFIIKGRVVYRGEDRSAKVEIVSGRPYSSSERAEFIRSYPRTCIGYERNRPWGKRTLRSILERFCTCLTVQGTSLSPQRDIRGGCFRELEKQAY